MDDSYIVGINLEEEMKHKLIFSKEMQKLAKKIIDSGTLGRIPTKEEMREAMKLQILSHINTPLRT